MLQRIRKWSQKGQGIVEYALILAFVVAIAAVALSKDSGLGQKIQDLFTRTGDKIETTSNSLQGEQTGDAQGSQQGGGG